MVQSLVVLALVVDDWVSIWLSTTYFEDTILKGIQCLLSLLYFLLSDHEFSYLKGDSSKSDYIIDLKL